VVNKNGDVIASAVTNLDLHDIARAAATYGARDFYVVTPLKDQKELVERIVSHWVDGLGARYNPIRRRALDKIRVKDSLTDVLDHISRNGESSPRTVATCARNQPGGIGYGRLRNMLKSGDPYLLLFGTAWGLSGDLITAADYVLNPVKGGTDYNHLSVRAAAAIILDRLMGRDN
jgi:hypothetical protein